MNRIVTGFDKSGRPVVVRQGQPSTVIHAGRYTTTELWVTDQAPPAASETDMATRRWELEPPSSGTCFRIVEIAPDETKGAGAVPDPGAGETDAGHAEFQEAHATATLDYITVLSGQVTLVVGDKEVTLGPGDSVVQQPGVPHDWQNRTGEPVVLSGVLLSAR